MRTSSEKQFCVLSSARLVFPLPQVATELQFAEPPAFCSMAEALLTSPGAEEEEEGPGGCQSRW